MQMLRFTIGGMMAVVLVAAIGFAALANANETWAGAFLLLVYALLGIAILGVIFQKHAARASWLGCALFEWGYLRMASWWGWGPLSAGLPTVKLLEILRAKAGVAPAAVPRFTIPDNTDFAQIANCLWALVAGILGATLARAFFALPGPSRADPQGIAAGPNAPGPRWWFRPALAILLVLALVGTVVAIWSTPDARLWAGGMYLLTCALLGIAALAAFFASGKSREISIGATLFGAGYLYMAMAYSRFPDFERPRPIFITNQFLEALRSRISWGTRRMTAADSRILKALEQPIAMQEIKEAPLEEVLAHIKLATSTPTYPGIPIYVDPIGLQEAEKTLKSTVSIDLQGLPLKTTLRLCLKQLGLMYFVEDGCLHITSQEQVEPIPETDDPFLIVGHSLLALIAAALGALAALLVSAAFRRRPGRAAAENAPAPSAPP